MKLKYVITGIDCPNCAAKLAALISDCEGINEAKINFLTEKLTVETSLSEDVALSAIKSVASKFSKDISVEK